MKALVCEMCNGSDMVKQDGFFVCQHCGMKYSAEEAKKMMVEGTVDVKGTVKVDTSDELANLYQVARRAKDDNNSETAGKYYDMILAKDPTSWEAAFYTVYFRSMQCKIAQITSAGVNVANCQNSAVALIRNYVGNEAEQAKAINEIVLKSMVISRMLFKAAVDHYNGIGDSIRSKYTDEMKRNCIAAISIMYNCGDAIEKNFKDNQNIREFSGSAWLAGYNMDKSGHSNYTTVTGKYKEKIKQCGHEYEKKILELDLAAINKTKPASMMARGICTVVFAVLSFVFLRLGAQGGGVLMYVLMAIFGLIAIFSALLLYSAPTENRAREKKKQELEQELENLKNK